MILSRSLFFIDDEGPGLTRSIISHWYILNFVFVNNCQICRFILQFPFRNRSQHSHTFKTIKIYTYTHHCSLSYSFNCFLQSEDGRANGYSRSRSRSRSRLRSHSPGVPQYVVHRCTGKDIAIYIDKFSRFFFPFAFFILNVSYWTTYGTM